MACGRGEHQGKLTVEGSAGFNGGPASQQDSYCVEMSPGGRQGKSGPRQSLTQRPAAGVGIGPGAKQFGDPRGIPRGGYPGKPCIASAGVFASDRSATTSS